MGFLEEVEPVQKPQKEQAKRAQPKGYRQEEEARKGLFFSGKEKAIKQKEPRGQGPPWKPGREG